MSRGAGLRPDLTDDFRLTRARERFLSAERIGPGDKYLAGELAGLGKTPVVAMVTKTEALLRRTTALIQSRASTQEDVDNQRGDWEVAKAAVGQAEAKVRASQLSLDWTKVVAPLSGRISRRYVDPGNLIKADDTILTSIVSLDPIYLDFDISENDYAAFQRSRGNPQDPLDDTVHISPTGDSGFTRSGKLDFIDNALDRSSGTIHARATVPNPDLFLAPGQFARIRVAIAPPTSVYLLPDSAVVLDQSQRLVMTVAPDGTVKPKIVTTGDLRGGLRVILSGLEANDRVVIDGLVRAMPGAKVAPQDGTIHYDATADGQG